jgi:hypothetical protein
VWTKLLKTDFTQPDISDLPLEQILPLDLVKTHCKIDDLPGITNDQLSLYRQAAFEAAELYTGKKWIGKTKMVQEIKSPKFRNLAQAAIARIPVHLDYIPINGIVNIYGNGDKPLFWLDGLVLPVLNENTYHTIKLPPGSQEFQMNNNIMFFSAGIAGNCSNPDVTFEQSFATATYIAGISSPSQVPAGIKLGCLKYIAWSIENPGDQFVPMVVRQVGVTTVSNDPAYSSGAIDEWRRHRRNVAR